MLVPSRPALSSTSARSAQQRPMDPKTARDCSSHNDRRATAQRQHGIVLIRPDRRTLGFAETEPTTPESLKNIVSCFVFISNFLYWWTRPANQKVFFYLTVFNSSSP